MKNNKGFTLIEMLVVIAVVGILSAAVLTALGPSRAKAKDTRIISALNQVRIVAETVFNGNYDLVIATQTQIAPLVADIATNGGGVASFTLTPTTLSTAYQVHANLASGGYYCVDSIGASKAYTTAPTWGASCP